MGGRPTIPMTPAEICGPAVTRLRKKEIELERGREERQRDGKREREGGRQAGREEKGEE